MEPSVRNLWNKSLENLEVCRLARGEGHFNAAASRYYYAMRMAVHALFKKKGIEGEWKTASGGYRVEEWKHRRMIDVAGERFSQVLPGIARFLGTTRELRERADYEPLPIGEHQLQPFIRMSKRIFRGIFDEIRRS